ncbi:MAG: hypothetical protein RLZZ239_1003 [Pseudomonadota bacterium]|jgi:uncharacterized protein
MKYLFILLVVLVVIWAIKRGRAKPPSAGAPPAEPAKPSEMVTCAHCGIHLPHEEAVNGQKGVYCSTEHRTAAQDRNPV